MNLDKEKIIKKMNVINKALQNLMKLYCISKEEFLSDFKYYDSAKYNLPNHPLWRLEKNERNGKIK